MYLFVSLHRVLAAIAGILDLHWVMQNPQLQHANSPHAGDPGSTSDQGTRSHRLQLRIYGP